MKELCVILWDHFLSLYNFVLSFGFRIDLKVLDFVVISTLRNSDIVVYDRQSESWWKQVQCRAIVGVVTLEQQYFLSIWMESVDVFRGRN